MSEVMEKLLAEGRAEGRIDGFIELVKDGILPIDTAAQKAGMSEEEFKKLL